jgi:hypothetical protein
MKQTAQQIAPGQVIKNGKLVYSCVTINAPVHVVWDILMDFASYPSWNPFVRAISGNPYIGSKITACLCLPGKKEMKFTPTVLQVLPNREFRWLGNLIMPHLFDGEHTFRLQDKGDGTLTFHHYERFRGLLIPFMGETLDFDTLKGFELMNAALKQRAEQVS